jgi:hypothetical protein
VAEKRIAVLLYGADRELWRGSGATLLVTDLNREGLRVLVRRRLVYPTIEIILRNLPFDTGQVYGVTIEADGHRPASQLVQRASFLRQDGDRQVERPDRVFRLMIVPRNATSGDLAAAHGKLVEIGSAFARFCSQRNYDELDPQRQMTFLNIEAKLRETYIGADSLLSFVRDIRGVARDRLFLMVEPRLKAAVDRSADFAGAAGHRAPKNPPGLPAFPDSWKHTRFEFGNVQLSFSRHTEPWGATREACYGVDVDIDLVRGLGHVAEWLENNVLLRGKKTDPTFVYALLFGQGIYPVYTLNQAD